MLLSNAEYISPTLFVKKVDRRRSSKVGLCCHIFLDTRWSLQLSICLGGMRSRGRWFNSRTNIRESLSVLKTVVLPGLIFCMARVYASELARLLYYRTRLLGRPRSASAIIQCRDSLLSPAVDTRQSVFSADVIAI